MDYLIWTGARAPTLCRPGDGFKMRVRSKKHFLPLVIEVGTLGDILKVIKDASLGSKQALSCCLVSYLVGVGDVDSTDAFRMSDKVAEAF